MKRFLFIFIFIKTSTMKCPEKTPEETYSNADTTHLLVLHLCNASKCILKSSQRNAESLKFLFATIRSI